MTLRQRLAAWCRRLADWIDAPIPAYTTTPEYQAALALAHRWREDRSVSGEFKRHQVYAALIKQFPTASHPLLSLRIEQAVQTLP